MKKEVLTTDVISRLDENDDVEISLKTLIGFIASHNKNTPILVNQNLEVLNPFGAILLALAKREQYTHVTVYIVK